jgi:amino acid transporter
MGDTVYQKLRETLRRRVTPRRHSALLVALIVAFAVRPLIGELGIGPGVFSIAVLLLMLISLYAIQIDELVGEESALQAERKRGSVIAWSLFLVALAERVVAIFIPTHSLYLATSICWLLFFAFVTWTEIRSLLRHREITRETISLSVSVYLLIGLTWGIFYIVLYTVQPHSISLGSTPLSGSDPTSQIFATLLYFSMTTLATIGYGDITPISLQARYAAVAEGIAGQLYLAILVARLVGVYISQSMTSGGADRSNADERKISQ